MAGTYTKEIITKNQNHIKSFYKGNGGMTAFANEIEGDIPYSRIAEMVAGGTFLVYTSDVRAYLHRLGLKDDKKLDKFKWSYYRYGRKHDMDGPFALYAALLARDGEKLYKDWVKKHPKRK